MTIIRYAVKEDYYSDHVGAILEFRDFDKLIENGATVVWRGPTFEIRYSDMMGSRETVKLRPNVKYKVRRADVDGVRVIQIFSPVHTVNLYLSGNLISCPEYNLISQTGSRTW